MKTNKFYINKKRFFPFIIVTIIIVLAAIIMITSRGNTFKMSNEQLQGGKIMLAARAYVYSDLTYDDAYFGGYPPDNKGVCTDVIWKGMMAIDVTLKDLVDDDIERNFSAYDDVIEYVDPGIDFRQVPVLEIYFRRHSDELSTNVRNLFAWKPGDIVVFESSHIAIVSCLRNVFGEPYVIQHGKDPGLDEDRLNASDGLEISSHFRWREVS